MKRWVHEPAFSSNTKTIRLKLTNTRARLFTSNNQAFQMDYLLNIRTRFVIKGFLN
jgi:hypothetical protein